jgi:transposase, IS5 family
LVLRQFGRVYFQDVPDDTVLIRWAKQIQPETLVAFDARLSGLALELKGTRGRKLRTDGTVMETNIAYPSNSKLLADGVRILSRTLKRLRSTLADGTEMAATLFRDRSRSVRNQARRIQRQARQRSEQAKAGMRTSFHAGIEGRISVIKRKYGLDRCQYHGAEGFARWIGWGVIANNLTQIGRKLAHPAL